MEVRVSVTLEAEVTTAFVSPVPVEAVVVQLFFCKEETVKNKMHLLEYNYNLFFYKLKKCMTILTLGNGTKAVGNSTSMLAC